ERAPPGAFFWRKAEGLRFGRRPRRSMPAEAFDPASLARGFEAHGIDRPPAAGLGREEFERVDLQLFAPPGPEANHHHAIALHLIHAANAENTMFDIVAALWESACLGGGVCLGALLGDLSDITEGDRSCGFRRFNCRLLRFGGALFGHGRCALHRLAPAAHALFSRGCFRAPAQRLSLQRSRFRRVSRFFMRDRLAAPPPKPRKTEPLVHIAPEPKIGIGRDEELEVLTFGVKKPAADAVEAEIACASELGARFEFELGLFRGDDAEERAELKRPLDVDRLAPPPVL